MSLELPSGFRYLPDMFLFVAVNHGFRSSKRWRLVQIDATKCSDYLQNWDLRLEKAMPLCVPSSNDDYRHSEHSIDNMDT